MWHVAVGGCMHVMGSRGCEDGQAGCKARAAAEQLPGSDWHSMAHGPAAACISHPPDMLTAKLRSSSRGPKPRLRMTAAGASPLMDRCTTATACGSTWHDASGSAAGQMQGQNLGPLPLEHHTAGSAEIRKCRHAALCCVCMWMHPHGAQWPAPRRACLASGGLPGQQQLLASSPSACGSWQRALRSRRVRPWGYPPRRCRRGWQGPAW